MRTYKILLTVLIALFFLALLLTSCAPKTALVQTITRYDTTRIVTDRIVTDTLFLGAEYYTVTDTLQCPAGLVRDSIITMTNTVFLEGKNIPVSITVHDTIFRIQQAPVSAAQILSSGYSWGERLAWLAMVLLLVSGWLRPRKNTPNTPPKFD